jgi:hypothetical protein
MQAALIMMTILGCDDSATDCRYIATLNQRWPTIEMCDAVSEKQLQSYINVSYPVVVAVCQDPRRTQDTAQATAPLPSPAPLKAPETAAEERAEEQTLAQQAIARARTILPTGERMRSLVQSPLRMAEDGYSWVIKKLR